MEQDQCLMWTKKKYPSSSSTLITSPITKPPSYDDESSSWEEQAFAEDAVGGGCIWPPRSYSCSFCRREFRSAQALGGHMNVHRRDRARLKQPSSPQNDLESHHPLSDHVQNNSPYSSLSCLYPSNSLGGLAYHNKSTYSPNSSDPVVVVVASPNSKVLDPSSVDHENCKEETMIPLYNSSTILKGNNTSKGLGDDDGDDKTDHDVGVSLNNWLCVGISCGKRKKDANSSIPLLFPKTSSVHHMKKSQMFELISPSTIEELDLELRLGHRPKV